MLYCSVAAYAIRLPITNAKSLGRDHDKMRAGEKEKNCVIELLQLSSCSPYATIIHIFSWPQVLFQASSIGAVYGSLAHDSYAKFSSLVEDWRIKFNCFIFPGLNSKFRQQTAASSFALIFGHALSRESSTCLLVCLFALAGSTRLAAFSCKLLLFFR
jgi:hypothetical protein